MRRSRWNVSISRKTLRKPPGGSASSTRCGKSCSFAKPVISRLRRVISPNPLRLSASLLGDRHYDQLGAAGRVITYRKEPPLRQHHHVQAVLRHVDTAKREHGHLRIPSLLMRARALATVRVWKKRPEHQAHSRFDIRDGCGLPVATGAEL